MTAAIYYTLLFVVLVAIGFVVASVAERVRERRAS